MKFNSIFSLRILSTLVILTALLFNQNSFAQQAPAQHDGQHDFDFNFGKWRSHIQSLEHPYPAPIPG
jgi:hypothetical protein